jgi:hypothetical protein
VQLATLVIKREPVVPTSDIIEDIGRYLLKFHDTRGIVRCSHPSRDMGGATGTSAAGVASYIDCARMLPLTDPEIHPIKPAVPAMKNSVIAMPATIFFQIGSGLQKIINGRIHDDSLRGVWKVRLTVCRA